MHKLRYEPRMYEYKMLEFFEPKHEMRGAQEAQGSVWGLLALALLRLIFGFPDEGAGQRIADGSEDWQKSTAAENLPLFEHVG